MSANQLKFSVRDINVFIEESMNKLYELGFTGTGSNNEVILTYYKGEEIPFEAANAAKVLMEKHTPEGGVGQVVFPEANKEWGEIHVPDLSVIEDKHEEHHEEQHEEVE